MMFFASVVFACSLGICTGFAQGRSGKEPSKAVFIAGCLVKGDEPNKMLVQKEGTIYGLESFKIELKGHLGYKVILRGFVLPGAPGEADEKAQEQNGNGKYETARFSCADARDDWHNLYAVVTA
jgi:hypothetical protein